MLKLLTQPVEEMYTAPIDNETTRMTYSGYRMEGGMSTTNMTGGDDIKRWTAKRRVALVLEIVRGELHIAEAARRHDLTVAEIEQWQDRFLNGAENALRSRPLDEEALKEQEIKRLQRKVGELVMALDILKEATKGHLSFRQMREEERSRCLLHRCVACAGCLG